MENIELAVSLDACDFTVEVEEWCEGKDLQTHCQNDVFRINWKEDNNVMTNWLLETYGEGIKKYEDFAIWST